MVSVNKVKFRSKKENHVNKQKGNFYFFIKSLNSNGGNSQFSPCINILKNTIHYNIIIRFRSTKTIFHKHLRQLKSQKYNHQLFRVSEFEISFGIFLFCGNFLSIWVHNYLIFHLVNESSITCSWTVKSWTV